MRRVLLFMCVTALCLVSLTAIGDVEPNDDFEDAEQIGPGVHAGELDCGLFSCDNSDYYSVTLVAGEAIYVNVTSVPKTSLWLYDEQQNLKIGSTVKTSHNLSWMTGSSAPSSFTCFIVVGRSSGEGTYTLEVSVISQNDANTGRDAGDRFDTATLVNEGIRYSGFQGGEDYNDYYSIGIQQESEMIIDLWSNDEHPAQASIYDEERALVDLVSIQYGAHDNASVEVLEPQTIYVLVDTDGAYSFQITLKPLDSTNEPFDDGTGSDMLSLLWSWLPYIIVLLILVFVVVAIISVAKRKS